MAGLLDRYVQYVYVTIGADHASCEGKRIETARLL